MKLLSSLSDEPWNGWILLQMTHLQLHLVEENHELTEGNSSLVDKFCFQLLENLLICVVIATVRNIVQLGISELLSRDRKLLEHYQTQIVTIHLTGERGMCVNKTSGFLEVFDQRIKGNNPLFASTEAPVLVE